MKEKDGKEIKAFSEFTSDASDNGNVVNNFTGVDGYSLPINVKTFSNSGVVSSGYDGNLQSFLDKVRSLYEKYDPTGA